MAKNMLPKISITVSVIPAKLVAGYSYDVFDYDRTIAWTLNDMLLVPGMGVEDISNLVHAAIANIVASNDIFAPTVVPTSDNTDGA